mmetsp:Transcript_25236/g.46893  ORF Transcript_25236/g.46893 Transcript_25236/m.46893 type:complete len:236 (-) Transcript_25236:283-990(-)
MGHRPRERRREAGQGPDVPVPVRQLRRHRRRLRSVVRRLRRIDVGGIRGTNRRVRRLAARRDLRRAQGPGSRTVRQGSAVRTVPRQPDRLSEQDEARGRNRPDDLGSAHEALHPPGTAGPVHQPGAKQERGGRVEPRPLRKLLRLAVSGPGHPLHGRRAFAHAGGRGRSRAVRAAVHGDRVQREGRRLRQEGDGRRQRRRLREGLGRREGGRLRRRGGGRRGGSGGGREGRRRLG